MSTKTNKNVTSRDRINEGFAPFKHPDALYRVLLNSKYAVVMDEIISSAKSPTLFATNIDKLLNPKDVWDIAHEFYIVFDMLDAPSKHVVVKQLIKDGCVQSHNHEEKVTTFILMDIEAFFLKINANYRKSVRLGLPSDLSKAIDVVTTQLADDPDYRRGWVANIAMSVVDTYTTKVKSKAVDIHAIANEGAERFINLLVMRP